MHLAAGTSVGLTGVAAGYTIGIVGDAVRTACRVCGRRSSDCYLGCSSIHATISGLRGNDSDSDFR
jgi:V-type H+-transporting ATPase proteolipid subunit